MAIPAFLGGPYEVFPVPEQQQVIRYFHPRRISIIDDNLRFTGPGAGEQQGQFIVVPG